MSALAQPRPMKVIRLSQLVDPNPKQREFLAAMRRYAYLLYGGAAGGGKSFILRWALLIFLLEAWGKYGLRGVRVGLFCEDYLSLRDRHISKIKHEFPRELGEVATTKDEGLVFALRPELGEGIISLRNLDDPSKYQSVEFAAAAVDELTKNGPEAFEDIRQRLRWPGFPAGFIFPFMAATNPGSRGHAWVKRYWITRDFPDVLKREAAQFRYIRALAADNPKLPADYEAKQLATIVDPQKRKALQDGDWDLFAGQFFSEWRRELHVCEPFAIPAWWKRWVGTDWGFAKPWAVLWFAQSPDGQVYVYREVYETGCGAARMARKVKEASGEERIEFTKMDPSCWDGSKDKDGKSIAAQCAEAGWSCQPAANDRVNGWTHVRSFLDHGSDRKPALQIFASCANLIRTLPALAYDVKNAEDCDSDAEDHAPDALRYGLMSRPPATRQPIETMPMDEAEALLRLQHATEAAAPANWLGNY